MSIYDEAIEVLPERLETDTLSSSIWFSQFNGSYQLAGGDAAQLALQRNDATIVVAQVNT